MLTATLRGGRLLTQLQREFIGLDTAYQVADGGTRRRVYLDSAATSLMLGVAHDTAREFLRHHANTHSRIHFSARAATDAYVFARAGCSHSSVPIPHSTSVSSLATARLVPGIAPPTT